MIVSLCRSLKISEPNDGYLKAGYELHTNSGHPTFALYFEFPVVRTLEVREKLMTLLA